MELFVIRFGKPSTLWRSATAAESSSSRATSARSVATDFTIAVQNGYVTSLAHSKELSVKIIMNHHVIELFLFSNKITPIRLLSVSL